MSVHEIGTAFSWLRGILGSDPTLLEVAPGGVWRSIAPDGTPTPFVIMSFQSGADTTTMNGFRVLDSFVCLVKAVGPARQMAQIEASASRIDDLIGKPPVSGVAAVGGYVGSSYRQSPFLLDELVAGVLWTSLGGLYRLLIEQM